MKRYVKPLMMALCLSGGLFLSACSSSPSDEELSQLAKLQADVKDLQGKVDAKNKEKADLGRQIAENNGKLQQCQSDQEAVKKGLGK